MAVLPRRSSERPTSIPVEFEPVIVKFIEDHERKARRLKSANKKWEALKIMGLASGAREALTVLDKAKRGWFGFDRLPAELRELAAMYERKSRSGLVGRDNDLEARAEALRWSASVATQYLRKVSKGSAKAMGMMTIMERQMDRMEAARQAAQQANQSKSDFISRMNHELRTPMNAILGFGQLLEADDNLSDEQRENVQHILKAGRHLLQLINEILDIARIEAGRMDVTIEVVDVGEMARDVAALMTPLSADRSIVFVVDPTCDGWVLADIQRLRQVILNLASNAVKYNREGGTVTISRVEQSGGTTRIMVTDTGNGIPRERFGDVFAPFERLGAEKTKIEGSGIGLSLCKKLIEAMEGELSFDSELGKGSTFWVDLPTAEPPISSTLRTTGGEESPTFFADKEQFHGRILYIEDNPANIAVVRRFLDKVKGVELVTSSHGTKGIRMAREHSPDLIFLDLHLPDISGYDVLEALQRDKLTRQVPVVIISADASEASTRRCIEGGAKDFLTKPLDMQAFYDALLRYLGVAPARALG